MAKTFHLIYYIRVEISLGFEKVPPSSTKLLTLDLVNHGSRPEKPELVKLYPLLA